MLSDYQVHAALPVSDLERAKRFYAEKLGLTPTQERAAGAMYELPGGARLFLFPTSITSRGGHTQVGIEVLDIEAAVADLRSRGVVFEEYHEGELKTSDGIATEPEGSRAVWFTDSEGNLLALVQFS